MSTQHKTSLGVICGKVHILKTREIGLFEHISKLHEVMYYKTYNKHRGKSLISY